LAFSILCLPALDLWAQEEEVVHTVKKGDTLWDISNKYLKTPWSWPLVWSNNEAITNPHLIYPGDKVVITYKDGAYRITIVPADGGEPRGYTLQEIADHTGKTMVLSPNYACYLYKDGAYRITIVPADGGEPRGYTLQEIADHTGKTMVLSPNYACYLYKDAKYTGEGTVAGKQDSGEFSSVDDMILIKMSQPTSSKGVAILTPLKVIKKKDATLGYVYKVIGLAEVKDTPSGLVRARITYANQEIKKGDIVTDNISDLKPLTIRLSQPALSTDGIILDYSGGIAGSSAADIIFTDIGASHGLKPGSLVNIYKPYTVKDEGTVEDYCGLALVIQSLDSSAMAVVLESTDILQKGYPVKAR